MREGAGRAGMSASAWWTECALTVDLSPKGKRARALVLDAGRQHSLSDGVSALARGLNAADEEALSQFRDDIRAMLEEPLRAMVRQGRREKAMELLRTVFGEDRATVIAAAFIPNAEEAPGPAPPTEPETGRTEAHIRRQASAGAGPVQPLAGKAKPQRVQRVQHCCDLTATDTTGRKLANKRKATLYPIDQGDRTPHQNGREYIAARRWRRAKPAKRAKFTANGSRRSSAG